MAKHLQDAGSALPTSIPEPFRKKGNLCCAWWATARKSRSSWRTWMVEAKREDWKNEFLWGRRMTATYARGSIGRAMRWPRPRVHPTWLKREGFKPKRDLILALTADEERGDVPSNGVYWWSTTGARADAPSRPHEGGGGERAAASPLNRIQVAEVFVSYEFMVRNPGGTVRRRRRTTRSGAPWPRRSRVASTASR
jgi:hypothetical protein